MIYPLSEIPSLEQLFGLQGKIAIVTGSGNGMGRMTAALMAHYGASVILADRDVDAASRVVREIEKTWPGKAVAKAAYVDIADSSSVKALFDKCESEFGVPDILVNNAAAFLIVPFEEMTEQEMDRVVSVNLRGTMLCTQECVRRMKSSGRGGSIVCVSSVGSLQTATFGCAAYGATKGAIDAMVRNLALEIAEYGIRINGVYPGAIDTLGDREFPFSAMPKGPIMSMDRIPMKRAGMPLELASAMLFLSSPAASYITGQLLVADGGFMVS